MSWAVKRLALSNAPAACQVGVCVIFNHAEKIGFPGYTSMQVVSIVPLATGTAK